MPARKGAAEKYRGGSIKLSEFKGIVSSIWINLNETPLNEFLKSIKNSRNIEDGLMGSEVKIALFKIKRLNDDRAISQKALMNDKKFPTKGKPVSQAVLDMRKSKTPFDYK